MVSTLPGFGERLCYYSVVSMPELESRIQWPGRIGFVHEVVLEVMGKSLSAHEIYFAGPPALAQAVQQLLARHAVPRAQVHYDAFY